MPDNQLIIFRAATVTNEDLLSKDLQDDFGIYLLVYWNNLFFGATRIALKYGCSLVLPS